MTVFNVKCDAHVDKLTVYCHPTVASFVSFCSQWFRFYVTRCDCFWSVSPLSSGLFSATAGSC